MSDNPATNMTPEELARLRQALRVLSYWDADDNPRTTALEDYILHVMPPDDEERLRQQIDFDPNLRAQVDQLQETLESVPNSTNTGLMDALEHLRTILATSRQLVQNSRGDGSTPGSDLEAQFARLDSIEDPNTSDFRDLRYLLEEALRRVKRLERHRDQLYEAIDAVIDASHL